MSISQSSLASRPAGVPSATLAMALFIATEVMFFAGLVSAFLVLRAEALVWPPTGQPRLPLGVTGLNTVLLVASGWTVQRGLAALRAGARPGPWLEATALLGALFLGIQGAEWVRLVGFGLTTTSSLYGGIFYTLVGAHALHVLAALVALLVVTARARRGRYRADAPEGLELCRMYWLFVVAVWPVLYVLVYLS
ncbi:MAG TPA: cytochrome c oxidase subunit 3 [Solirubrobacterales bacterium]|nr:cytochrome c oxidase subunit 3 [Solirubrobacterales bacterium]